MLGFFLGGGFDGGSSGSCSALGILLEADLVVYEAYGAGQLRTEELLQEHISRMDLAWFIELKHHSSLRPREFVPQVTSDMLLYSGNRKYLQ